MTSHRNRKRQLGLAQDPAETADGSASDLSWTRRRMRMPWQRENCSTMQRTRLQAANTKTNRSQNGYGVVVGTARGNISFHALITHLCIIPASIPNKEKNLWAGGSGRWWRWGSPRHMPSQEARACIPISWPSPGHLQRIQHMASSIVLPVQGTKHQTVAQKAGSCFLM